jgi:hypothetical protein
MQQIETTDDGKPLAGLDRAVIFKTGALGPKPGSMWAVPRIVGNPSQPAKVAYRTAFQSAMDFDSKLVELTIRFEEKMGVSKEDVLQFRRANRVAVGAGAQEALEVVKAERAKTADRRNKILTVPPLAANDLVTAIAENEARIGIRAMTPDQRANLFNDLAAGKHPATLLALCRDPVPGSQLGESARGTYLAQATKQNAEALGALDAEDEGHESVEAGLIAIQKLVATA